MVMRRERERERFSVGRGMVLLFIILLFFTRFNLCVSLLALTWGMLEVEQLKVEMDPWLCVVLGAGLGAIPCGGALVITSCQ